MGECIAEAKRTPGTIDRAPILREIFSFIDLTSLNTTDSDATIRSFAERTALFSYHFNDINNVAALCVYPNFVKVTHEALGGCGVRLAAVAASFPTAQTFTEVKILETSMAVRTGEERLMLSSPWGLS